jgi:hypothetical protein
MSEEPLRFKKSRASGGQSDCIEVAHTLQHLRDSKSAGSVLAGDVRALVAAVRGGRFGTGSALLGTAKYPGSAI